MPLWPPERKFNPVTDTEIKASTPPKSPKRSRRGYILLLVAVVVVVAGWSAAWAYGRSVLAEQMDLQLDRMAGQGLELACADLSIAGYPFRYEVACREMRTSDRSGATGSLGGLDAVALIYNPRHAIFEAHSPASLAVPLSGLAGEITWDTARASMKFGQDSLGALDAVIDKPEITLEGGVPDGLVSADKAEVHVREAPGTAGILEGFVTVDSLSLAVLPELSQAIMLRGHARIDGGMGLLGGVDLISLVRASGDGLPIELVLGEAVLGTGRATARGDLVLAGDGTISGALDLTLGNAGALVRALKRLFPAQDRTYPLLEGVVTSLEPAATEIDGVRSITIPVTITNGLVQLGLLPVGRIPPLFQAGT